MATESEEKAYSCDQCDESFEQEEQLHEHLEEVHGETPEEESAAADTDASGSTGSITEETNDSPSAAEPAEAAGPSGTDDDIEPDADEDDDA